MHGRPPQRGFRVGSCSFDGEKWERDETNITTQNPAETSKAPALAVLNDNLYAVYRAESKDNVLSRYLSDSRNLMPSPPDEGEPA